jgi:hypothetical protein
MSDKNFRIFYACQAVGIKASETIGEAPSGDETLPVEVVHGVQSVGINTNFPIEPVFELAMSQVYQNIENTPEVEVTIERVLDGYPLAYHLATRTAKSASLQARGKENCAVSLGIYNDTVDFASGNAPVEVYVRNAYVGNISYNFSTDGNFTESVTIVGNNKEWYTSDNTNPFGFSGSGEAILKNDSNNNKFEDDFPYAMDMGLGENGERYKGGVQRRQYFRMDKSILPLSVFGVKKDANGEPSVGNAYEGTFPEGKPICYVQSASISADFGREDIMALGQKGPYYKATNPSIEVSCDFEVIATSGDFVTALENGDPSLSNTRFRGDNTREERILLAINDGTVFDLGKKNKLQSVSYGGGDSGGGNVSLSYSYQTYNDLTILHPFDPIWDEYSDDQKEMVVQIGPWPSGRPPSE